MNTPINDMLDWADELAAAAIELRWALDHKSKYFNPYEAKEALEKIVDFSHRLGTPENFCHIKTFIEECEKETRELEETKNLSPEELWV